MEKQTEDLLYLLVVAKNAGRFEGFVIGAIVGGVAAMAGAGLAMTGFH